jgi:hypothetical protein
MSVVLTADGSITGSINAGTVTLGNPIPSNPLPETVENRDLLTGDGGVMIAYKKGRRRLIRTLQIHWLVKADVTNLKAFFELVDSTNWFTLQDNFVLTKTAIAHQSWAGDPTKNTIHNTTAFQSWLYPIIDLTAFCMSVTGGGGNTGSRRRVYQEDLIYGYYVVTSPDFTNNIQVGDNFILGVPVMFSAPPKIEPLSYNKFKVTLQFEEEII